MREPVRVVELWPTFGQATEARKRYARTRDARAFGARVLAFDAWVEELWALFGDGRAFVSAVEREVLVAAALERTGWMAGSAGAARLVASIVREASGLDEFETALSDTESAHLTEAERRLLAAAACYRAGLKEARLAEQGEALRMLARSIPAREVPWRVTLKGFDELAEGPRRFLAQLAARGCAEVATDSRALVETGRADLAAVLAGVDAGFGEPIASEDAVVAAELRDVRATVFFHSQERTVEPSGAVRFVLPMGRYATAPLLAQEVARLVKAARVAGEPVDGSVPVVVSCVRPLRTFESIARRLEERGIAVAVQGSRPFKETAFGRAFLSLARFVHGDAAARTGRMLTDFMESPFSGVSLATAQRFDARWRGDRDLAHSPEALLRLAAEQGEWAALMVEAAEDGDALQIKPALERLVAARTDWSEGFRAEQLRAIGALCEVGNVAARFGVPFGNVLGLLENRPVFVSVSTGEEPAVLVMGEGQAAQLAPASAFALISADMTAADRPVRTERGAKEALFERLGISLGADSLTRARARFARTLTVPHACLVLSRPLNTVDADEQYPSVMFEEVLDCYRADITADDDLDRTLGIPARLVSLAVTGGEDSVGESVERSGEPPANELAIPREPTGEITPDRREKIVVSRIETGPAKGCAALSATQLESYLECPYKWFSLRRLRLDVPDAGFGAMEMGVLVHTVMNRFYARLQEADPHARVTADNVAEARELAAAVFWECFEHQRTSSSDVRVAPQGELELAQVRDLETLVEDFVEGEAAFLPGFTPRYAEWEFGDARPVMYAGQVLRGSIDRIDVDEKGRAVVVDYKGGIGSGTGSPYLLVAKSADDQEGFVLPGKVQALVYAQIARRELGLDVVGAIYANYSKGTAAGAVDDTVVDPACARMEGPARTRCCLSKTGFASFGTLLDEVEARVAAALERMMAGEIAAMPATPDACAHCPVTVCDKRTA